MEKLAYLVIGASIAIVTMTFWPNHLSSPSAQMQVGETDMVPPQDMEAMHAHPPRNVSQNLPVPSVTHLMFPDMMDGYNIQILTRNFTFTPADINREAKDNEGHAHIYVNGTKIARVYSNWYHLSGAFLAPGHNDIKVTLNANDHGEWSIDDKPIFSVVRVEKALSE